MNVTGVDLDREAAGPSGLRDVRRILSTVLGLASVRSDAAMGAASGTAGSTAGSTAGGAGGSLESLLSPASAPAIRACRMLEAAGAQPVASPGTAEASDIVAFLDGVQHSRIAGHVGGVPIIYATVAAAIRQRTARQFSTWGAPAVSSALFTDRSQLGPAAWDALTETGITLVDCATDGESNGMSDNRLPEETPSGDTASSESSTMQPPAVHPLAVRARAAELIALARETEERRLAAAWCRKERSLLWIDGGISGNLAIDATAPAFGVVKSHATLHGDGAAVRQVFGLRAGERSALFLAGADLRRAVASWYLRLHDAADGDPLYGLVRVEVAPSHGITSAAMHGDPAPDVDVQQLASRADRLSRWILEERTPLSLPDPRWPTLVYGVHACENFLRAIQHPLR